MRLVLEQKQMLKMVMTTELRQAIELLQLSTYELLQFIQQQAEENPFIEFIENNYDTPSFDKRPRSKQVQQEVDPIEFTVKKEKNMYDHLLEQIIWVPLSEKEYKIVHYLILNINEQGFLVLNNEEIARKFDIDEQEVLRMKRILHKLEPCGIGTSNLVECLSVQAENKFPDDEVLQQIIQQFLQELADKQWQKISKALTISLGRIKEAFEQIQTLNPRPAAAFSTTKIDYVTPDISIVLDENESIYRVQLNDHYIPNIQFNRDYSSELPKSKEVSQYVNEHFKKFEWLQKSIMQRRSTIMKIMGVIIRHQEDFLQDGLRSLKPLTLKDVADEIEMHESTVSRATANKIVQTPAGTFELRHLFSTKLKTATGDDTSQTTVKEMIRELVEKEDKYKPLSDQKIADVLSEQNVVISRRTVAKYRDELQIPSSSKRKEIKL